MKANILQLFPIERRAFWRDTAAMQERISEIRFRCNRPIIVEAEGKEHFLDGDGFWVDNPERAYCAQDSEMEAILNHICHYSMYAFEDELRQGFITVPGGHRVGVAGQVVLNENGSVRTIKNISCINIRISHQIRGAADKVLPFVYEKGEPKNTLIISPPGCGKTTLLRDLIRQLSDGNRYATRGWVAEGEDRAEIAGSNQGEPQNDIGMRTDVLDACPKALGMMILLRSMSPRVVAIDELGGEEDMQALQMAASCGSKIVATVHGSDVGDVLRRFGMKGERVAQMFDCYLILGREKGKPVVKKVVGKEEIYASLGRGNHDCSGLLRIGNVVPESVYSSATDLT